MSPPDMEKLVTRPIEIELAGLPKLTQVRSVSKIGLSAITVVFEDGVDDYFARQLVFERLSGAKDKLPAGGHFGARQRAYGESKGGRHATHRGDTSASQLFPNSLSGFSYRYANNIP